MRERTFFAATRFSIARNWRSTVAAFPLLRAKARVFLSAPDHLAGSAASLATDASWRSRAGEETGRVTGSGGVSRERKEGEEAEEVGGNTVDRRRRGLRTLVSKSIGALATHTTLTRRTSPLTTMARAIPSNNEDHFGLLPFREYNNRF